MRKTLTYDRGREMVRHNELTANTGIAVYFCDSHSPSPGQRGSNENINGFVRQLLPKGTDLSSYSQARSSSMRLLTRSQSPALQAVGENAAGRLSPIAAHPGTATIQPRSLKLWGCTSDLNPTSSFSTTPTVASQPRPKAFQPLYQLARPLASPEPSEATMHLLEATFSEPRQSRQPC